MIELLNESMYNLMKDSQVMRDLYDVIGKNDDLEHITPQAHSAMVNILEYLEEIEHVKSGKDVWSL